MEERKVLTAAATAKKTTKKKATKKKVAKKPAKKKVAKKKATKKKSAKKKALTRPDRRKLYRVLRASDGENFPGMGHLGGGSLGILAVVRFFFL
ncbi:MAG: hypothetical protein R6X35_15715, partial [Candidatus Krumholzibacteriia bacterium]